MVVEVVLPPGQGRHNPLFTAPEAQLREVVGLQVALDLGQDTGYRVHERLPLESPMAGAAALR